MLRSYSAERISSNLPSSSSSSSIRMAHLLLWCPKILFTTLRRELFTMAHLVRGRIVCLQSSSWKRVHKDLVSSAWRAISIKIKTTTTRTHHTDSNREITGRLWTPKTAGLYPCWQRCRAMGRASTIWTISLVQVIRSAISGTESTLY